MAISNHVKQACRLEESILAAVTFAELYSIEARALAIEEVKLIIDEEEPGKAQNVLKAYLELLQEG